MEMTLDEFKLIHSELKVHSKISASCWGMPNSCEYDVPDCIFEDWLYEFLSEAWYSGMSEGFPIEIELCNDGDDIRVVSTFDSDDGECRIEIRYVQEDGEIWIDED